MAKNFMKSQGPRQNGHYKQGYYGVVNREKYVGDISKVIYRSSWEEKLMRFCDLNENILSWSNEPVAIPYYDPLTNVTRRYYVDFAIVTRDNNGTVTKWLLEVKPSKQISPPKAPNRMTDKQTDNYLRTAKAYIINQAKFEAAKLFAADRGFKFGIITENFLFRQK
jgi:hypothetical protein